MTWSPLACGLITGKYSDGVPECSRAAMKVSVISQALLWDFSRRKNEPGRNSLAGRRSTAEGNQHCIEAFLRFGSRWRGTSGWRSGWTARRAAGSWLKSRSSICWRTGWAALLHSWPSVRTRENNTAEQRRRRDTLSTSFLFILFWFNWLFFSRKKHFFKMFVDIFCMQVWPKRKWSSRCGALLLIDDPIFFFNQNCRMHGLTPVKYLHFLNLDS